MIRRLEERDRAAAIHLLGQEPSLNLYFLGNIYQIGFSEPFCEFWGDFDVAGQLRGIINRYRSGWIVYGQPNADWPGLGHLLDEHPVGAERLQDNPGGVASFLPFIHRYEPTWAEEETLMELPKESFAPLPQPAHTEIRRATLADLDRLVAFYTDAEQMARSPERVEFPLRNRRIWLAQQGDVVLSAGLTNAEITDRAMIGGVYTKSQVRGQGLSGAVISGLCAELLTEGKQPVLYWENPIAGRVYRRIGFRQINTWRSIRLAPVSS